MTDLIRLYVDQPLCAGQSIALRADHAHYLFAVMRRRAGAHVCLFNGRDGAWLAQVEEVGRKSGSLRILEQTAAQHDPPDLWLVFAPIKKARTDFIVEKAAELGVSRIIPVQTDHTNAERIRQDRLQAHAVEAAEQCGGTFVPEVTALVRLADILKDWPENRSVMFCDESAAGHLAYGIPKPLRAPAAILIGPEGGFSEQERKRLQAMPQAHSISLGPRILRADTAAVAAMALWQSTYGDWG